MIYRILLTRLKIKKMDSNNLFYKNNTKTKNVIIQINFLIYYFNNSKRAFGT